MTARTVNRDTPQERVVIQCDDPGCPVQAPPATEIAGAHGLRRLGWYCYAGRHLCPGHVPVRG